MAIAPSNNLLSALSQLQGSTRPAAPARPQAPAGGSAPVQNSFAAQLANTANPIRTQVADQRPLAPQTFSPTQPRPIPTRGGYLGQHVNIVV